MDLGDWQELSRLRGENHLWHRCVDEIMEMTHASGVSGEQLAAAIENRVSVLNQRLAALHRRAVN